MKFLLKNDYIFSIFEIDIYGIRGWDGHYKKMTAWLEGEQLEGESIGHGGGSSPPASFAHENVSEISSFRLTLTLAQRKKFANKACIFIITNNNLNNLDSTQDNVLILRVTFRGCARLNIQRLNLNLREMTTTVTKLYKGGSCLYDVHYGDGKEWTKMLRGAMRTSTEGRGQVKRKGVKLIVHYD
jgi:hypothetical protein